MTLIKPGHIIAHDDRFLTWLGEQDGVEINSTVEVEVDTATDTAIIRQFERDPEDGIVLLEQTENGSMPKMAEPISVKAPHWLLELAA